MFLTATGGAAGGSSMIIMLILIFVIFYFFMIRPENKRKKKLEEMRSELTVGDEIVTIGGIIGKVVQATEDTITFETGEDRVRIQVKKWAISTTAKRKKPRQKQKLPNAQENLFPKRNPRKKKILIFGNLNPKRKNKTLRCTYQSWYVRFIIGFRLQLVIRSSGI